MIRYVCDVDVSEVDLLEALMWEWGATVVSTTPPDANPIQLSAFFVDESCPDPMYLSQCMADYLGRTLNLARSHIVDDGWQERWREEFQPLKVGPFWVVGEWDENRYPEPCLRVYPGQAFGTGQHETTALMLEHLATCPLDKKDVLDIGCGTGILSIAASKLGARSVLGIEIDPDCNENMQRHLQINDTMHVTLLIGTIDQVADSFDVILANITLNVLLEIWPWVKAHLRPGGYVLSSGLLISQKGDALRALSDLGAHTVELARKGEWLVLRSTWP
ncbi:MAG: 50S ribosomal protein L11 methyltransferase [Acidobacteria bacterium]|nr:50S ribosomal protein L11 methyltransferase [Acidobacteriota bacterium]